jgi:serine/threonine-protein kinase
MSASKFPREFGKYVLLRPFARGGMGELFIAASGDLGGAEKLCLIKKVPEDRDSPGLTARLLDEAKVAVRLNHTNLVQVFDAGRVDEELYIAMELIEGRDLRAVWNRTAERRSRIPLDVALLIVREMARGLDYAHNYGGLNLVHRDIAPPNVLLSWHGEVKLTDFGLARSILKNERTAPGIVYGRVAYLAPEQARGEQADPRTDIFATGVILWELLTGRPLNEPTDDAVKNLERARHPRPDAPSKITRGLLPSIDAMALRALAPDRAQRFQSAEDFRKAVAEELGRVAPGTDASRLSTFLRDLFPDEIKNEAVERERLLREELPEWRSQRREGRKTPPRIDLDEPSVVTDRRRVEGTGAPRNLGPPPIPSLRPSAMDEPPTEVRKGRGALRAAMDKQAGADSIDDDDLTRMKPPKLRTGNIATRALPARAPAQALDEEEIDPESDTELSNLEGEVLDGRYRVLRLLGTGGMGAVYEAEHIEIGRKLAIKVLHPRYSRQADLVARFRREARAATKVGHPNIVEVTDSGTTEHGDVYFVMERLDGLDLGEVLRHERRIAADRTVVIATQICRALSAAHAAGIIHRDLKPENIFLCSRDGNADFVKVLDFGIAKHDMGNQNLPRRMTAPGVAMGTPEYMAPEQAAGKSIDGRVDIYSVGAIMYEMLTAEPPHRGDSIIEVLQKKATEQPRSIREYDPSVPEALERVVLRCLERDADQRPQTMGELEYELNKAMKGRGSAVAAVLGLKTTDADPSVPPNAWGERPRRDTGSPSPGGAAPASPSVAPTGLTGALPLRADTQGNVAVAGPAGREGDTKQNTEPRPGTRKSAAMRKSGSRNVLATLLLLGIVGAGGWYLYTTQPWRGLIGSPPVEPSKVVPKPEEPPKVVVAPTPAPPVEPAPEQLTPAEIQRLLEWARRTAEGGRIIAPPGDNLKELLERIEAADPGNAEAQSLRARTVQVLNRKSGLALKRGRIDEAVQDLESLAALKPDDEKVRGQLARALRFRAERLLGIKRYNAAFQTITSSLELEPDSTPARIVLAEVYLAKGQSELAAEEYQRILDGRPADKRARRGLQLANAATAAKARLAAKKKGGKR